MVSNPNDVQDDLMNEIQRLKEVIYNNDAKIRLLETEISRLECEISNLQSYLDDCEGM